eukprot:Clim_evm41s55 gene=Clim_evmTU41s55
MPTAAELKDLGNKAFSAKNYDEAVNHYTAAIEQDPSNHVLYSNRSACYASLKQYDQAKLDAEQCISIKPDWPKGYSRLGTANEFLGDMEGAIKAYEKGLEIDPNNAQLRREAEAAASRAMGGPGGQDPIAQIFQDPELFAKLSTNPQTSALMADPTFVAQIQQIQQNPAMARSILQSNPNLAMAAVALLGLNMQPGGAPGAPPNGGAGGPMMTEEERQEQEKRMREEMERERRNREEDERRRKEREEEQKVKEDEEARKKAEAEARLAANPNIGLAEEAKAEGNKHYKAKEFEQAIACYSKAIELDPDTINYYSNRAAVYFEMKDFDNCIADCQKAVEVGRAHRADYKLVSKALTREGWALKQQGKLEDAINILNKALTEHRNPDTLDKLRKTEKELRDLKAAEYQSPELAEKARSEGNELFKAKKFPEAIKAYEEAIKRAPEDPRGYSNRAAAFMKMAYWHDAIKDCDAAIGKDEAFIKAYTRKAQSQVALKEYTKALETLEAANKVSPGNTEIEEQMRWVMTKSMEGAQNESLEERQKRAMQDPEVQGILADPAMQLILQQMSQDPQAAQDHLRNPQVMAKVQKLADAGIIQFGRQ